MLAPYSLFNTFIRTFEYLLTITVYIANDTITSPDRGSGSLTQDNHELASLIPMDVDAVGSTEPMIDSQTSSTTSMHYSDDAGQTQTNPRLSDHALTMTTKTPGVETIRVHSPTPSDLASAKDAQTSQITGLDGSAPKIDKSTDILNAGLPNVTPNVTSSGFYFNVSKCSFFSVSFPVQVCGTRVRLMG